MARRSNFGSLAGKIEFVKKNPKEVTIGTIWVLSALLTLYYYIMYKRTTDINKQGTYQVRVIIFGLITALPLIALVSAAKRY